ncbi:MAG: hypothetical protein ACJA1R_001062 [Flavobacteriales bacterium]|jgi:hypothetical protein
MLVVLSLGCGACGGYSTRIADARLGAQRGDLEHSLEVLDGLVANGQEGEKPEERDLPLLLLERAAVRQAAQDHQGATADFADADGMLEVLDLSPDRAGNAATYLWSESRTLYRPPVYEKLMVNVTALGSYLAAGNGSGAMVEARRINTLLEYFDTTSLGSHPITGAAAYMAGLAMELGGDEAAAAYLYRRACAANGGPGLAAALTRMAAYTPALRADADVVRAREALELKPTDELADGEGEVITIVFSGMAPYREPERIPIGIAFAWMRANAAYEMGSANQATYNRIAAEGLLTWINFPTLRVQDNPLRRFDVSVGGRQTSAQRVANVEGFALREWERNRAGIAFAAITRAIVRVVARETVQAVGNAAGGAGETVGFIAGLVAQGAMQAADVPDTRTWTMMPAYVWVSRMRVAAGEHDVVVRGTGGGVAEQVVSVDVREGGTRVVTVRFFD